MSCEKVMACATYAIATACAHICSATALDHVSIGTPTDALYGEQASGLPVSLSIQHTAVAAKYHALSQVAAPCSSGNT